MPRIPKRLTGRRGAISLIGAAAVPALREAYQSPALLNCPKLLELMEYFGCSPTEPESDGFAWLDDDEALILFAWIGLRLRETDRAVQSGGGGTGSAAGIRDMGITLYQSVLRASATVLKIWKIGSIAEEIPA